MRWSKLKQLIEDRFSEDLKNRLSIISTKYHQSKNEYGEVILELDKKKIYSASEWSAYKKTNGNYYNDKVKYQSEGISTEYDAPQLLFDSLSMSLEEMLEHHDLLIRAIAVSDKRLGKRRIEKIIFSNESELVQKILQIRFGH